MVMNKLKGKIAEAGYSQKQVAALIGINANSLGAKINGRRAFDTEEVKRLCKVLGIEDPREKCEIFLA